MRRPSARFLFWPSAGATAIVLAIISLFVIVTASYSSVLALTPLSLDTFTERGRTLLEDILTAPLSSSLASHSSADDICRPTGQIHDACCDYETVEKRLNTPLFYRTLSELVETNYFRYYKVDLYRDCPFWSENGLCMNKACGVEKASEAEIPEEFRSSRLSSVDPADRSEVIFPLEDDKRLGNKGSDPSSLSDAPMNSCVCRETDFCHWEAEDFSPEATWVDLIKNPERFTGYAGPGANRVWKAIYEENCFGAVPKGSFIEPPRAKSSGGGSGFIDKRLLTGGSSGAPGLFDLMPSLQAPVDPAVKEQCLEKRVFYRVISGLHASISTHICSEYLDQKTGEWSPNLECFVSRIAQHPERLQNIYFNYVLLVRALARAGDYFTSFRLKKGHSIPSSEQRTLTLLESLVSQANRCPPTFDEASMFQASNPEAPLLKQQFRDSFRNISSIMDCVGCDKCRLWGKMQVNGLGAAMKILFSFDEEDLVDVEKNPAPLLERSELVALINTLHRFAESLKAVQTFREIYQSDWKANGEVAVSKAEGAAKGAGEEAAETILTARRAGSGQSPTEEVDGAKAPSQHDTLKVAPISNNGSRRSSVEKDTTDPEGDCKGDTTGSAHSFSSRARQWLRTAAAHTFDVCKQILLWYTDWFQGFEGAFKRWGSGATLKPGGGDQEGRVALSRQEAKGEL